jgi:formate dehydrogenase major subunit
MNQARINGERHSFPEGLSVLLALRRLAIEVPHLCTDERLKPAGGCRLCLVKVAGLAHPVSSCTTTLADGMEIITHDEELESHRRTVLKCLARDYPLECIDRYPDKEFHRYLHQYELAATDDRDSTLSTTQSAALRDDSHPYIGVDMSRCVHCYRCVRICDEVQGQFVWQIRGHGEGLRIVPDSGTTLMASSCVSCGACVDTCPSGALEDRALVTGPPPTEWTKTTCPYCGTGCDLQVGTHQNRIVTIRPDEHSPVNHGHLCVKGRYAHAFVDAEDRITEPMLRVKGGAWQRVSWDVAIAEVARQFRAVLDRRGPEAIGVLGSARATNEENYLTQKVARVVLGTNNVDCCARVCHAPTAEAMKMMFGTGAATNSFSDIELAQTILVAGSNATENHPIVGARIKQAKLHGAKLIVIDPREIELARYADIHLSLRPGTNVLVFNAMAATIVEEQLVDPTFVKGRVAEFDQFAEFIRPFVPERVAAQCDIPPDLIRQAARLYAGHKPAMAFHGLGMTEHVQGTEGVMCLVNLALLTGNIGRRGAGINPLRGQNNVQGSAQMGCEPGSLTGYVPLEANRSRFEQAWSTSLPTVRGLNMLQMIDAAGAGQFKALWAIGYDILLTNANAHATREALGNMDCVVVQDMFLNETAKEFATVFLPAASTFEKDGTFMNAERRIQRVRRALLPRGASRSDWEIIQRVAQALGATQGFQFDSSESIWNEIRSVWPAVAGISYARIEPQGVQWPCLTDDTPGTEVLHTETFPKGPRAALARIEYRPTDETVSVKFPFLLVTGRTLFHFNAGTMTYRTANRMLHQHDYLDVCPEDAEQLGITDGASVLVRSRYGEATLVARRNTAVRRGQLFSTFHDPALFVNHLTSPHRDSRVSAPEYKVTAVQLQLVATGARAW